MSARHVFQILGLVNRSGTPLGPTELSRMTGLPLGTVHRALTTLEETRYIARDERTGQYRPGTMPQHLSQALFRRFPLASAVQPDLRRIAAQSGQTTSLCVRVGWYGMTIAVVDGAEDLYHRVQLGTVAPLVSGIASLAMLAFLDDAAFQACAAFHQLSKDAAASLQQTCSAIRADGAAFAQSPEAGAPAIALPLRDPGGSAVGALLVTGHRREFDARAAHLFAARDAIEARFREDPALCRSPYAHIGPDEIRFEHLD